MTGGQVHNVNILDELRLEAGERFTCSIAVRSVSPPLANVPALA
jgi:hypothetical protein